MKTRSQTKHQIYEVDIDFDSASKAWLSNKISIGNGSYKYKYTVCAVTKQDTNCKKPVCTDKIL